MTRNIITAIRWLLEETNMITAKGLCACALGLLVVAAHSSAQSSDCGINSILLKVYGKHVPKGLIDKYYVGEQETETTKDLTQFNFETDPGHFYSGAELVPEECVDPPARLRSLLQENPDSPDGAIPTKHLTKWGFSSKSDVVDFNPQVGILDLSMIVFILNVNGAKPKMSADEYRSKWWFTSNNASQPNMQDYFSSCSNSKARMTPTANNTVIDLTAFPMPASGRSAYSKLPYDFTKRSWGLIEMYVFQEWAQKQYALNFANGDESAISKFKRRIVIVPNSINGNPIMDVYGNGDVGCARAYCYVWITEDRMTYLNTMFHEISHTMYQMHSSTATWEYGDQGCVMGCADWMGCYNGPAAIRSGWAKVIASHYGNSTIPGTWYNYSIPSQRDNDTNVVRIFTDWTTPQWSSTTGLPAYYLSMKSRKGYDQFLKDQYINKLLIHVTKSTDYQDGFSPFLLGNNGAGSGLGLAPNGGPGKFVDEVTQLVITFKGIVNGEAQVSFCRYQTTVESGALCYNKLDDNCNGLVDAMEPGCTSGPICGDGTCNGLDTAQNCPGDCAMTCGDGYCDPRGETPCSCSQDCAPQCGDNCCSGSETVHTCPRDCPGTCGDGVCAPSEDAKSCGIDCQGTCGDGVCNSVFGETCSSCPTDCKRGCSQGVQSPSPSSESTFTSSPPPKSPPPPSPPPPSASPPPPSSPPPPKQFPPPPKQSPPPPKQSPPPPKQSPPPPSNGGADRGICGDGICTPLKESASQCPRDCPAVCGDKYCDSRRGEKAGNCPGDCPGWCGDGFCTQNDLLINCKLDCPTAGRRSLHAPATHVPYRRNFLEIAVDATGSAPMSALVSPDGAVAPESHIRRLIGGVFPEGDQPHDIVIRENIYGPPVDSPLAKMPNLISKRRLSQLSSPHYINSDINIVCGDGVCSDDEDVHLCAKDCCPSGKCGDGLCQGWLGEHCENCPEDCRGDLDGEDKFCCGAFIGCKDDRCFEGGAKCQVKCISPDNKRH